MNLGKYESKFREQQIDGALLLSLDKEDLVSDLSMGGLDAKKILLFSRENWRPNESAVPLAGNHKDATSA